MSIKDRAAIVGVGATSYHRRGGSYPEGELSMACTAILAALSAEAHMYREVADGRVFRLRLYAYIQDNFVNDNRAYLDIELWNQDNKP